MSRRVTTTLSAAALACALVLSGCGEESAPSANTSAALSAITVEGTDAKTAPTVKVDAPVTVTKTESKVLTEGTGEAITKDDLVSIQAIILNGTDGKQAHSTWETGPVGLDLGAQDLFGSFKSQLPGKKIGSRVLITSTPADAFGEQGNPDHGQQQPRPRQHVVVKIEGKPATITVPKGAKAPAKTVVQPLITGKGAEVKAGQTVRVAYTGALLKDGSVFDSSASRPEQPYFDFAAGQGQVISGWDKSIVGQKVGSRLLLVIPPAEGYGEAGSPPKIAGTDTLVFVVDILAAY